MRQVSRYLLDGNLASDIVVTDNRLDLLSLGSGLMGSSLALDDLLDLPMDILEIVENIERNAFAFAIGDQIMPILRKKQIRLPRRRQITNPITTIEQLGPLALGLLVIRLDRQTLIVTKVGVIAVDDVPGPVLVDLDVVGDDLDVRRGGADEVGEQSADDGLHAGGDDDDGDVLRTAPGVEGGEAGVEFDVFAEELDAFGEGEVDAVEHVLEGVTGGC